MKTRRPQQVGVSLVLAALLVLSVQAASAATFVLAVGMDGRQEVPPTSSPATGFGSFNYDDATGRLTFNIFLSSSTLQGTETAAHIHGPALPGANGPILFSLSLGTSKSGTVTLTAAQGADLLAGNFYVDIHTTAFPDGEIRGQIAQALLSAAVLPGSRSVQVGTPATAFATIVNSGPNKATSCGIALASAIPATLTYQTTNPSTNTVTGTPNTPVDIPFGGSQSFVFSITPSAPISPTDVQLQFDCANSPPAATIIGVNTFLLSASTTPVADVIAIALPSSVRVDRTSRQGAFAVSALNVGASDTITVTADTGTTTLPVVTTLCQTSATGACVNPPAPSVTVPMSNGSGAGFAVFVTANGEVQSNPAVNRIFMRFKDGNGVTRGLTSVAIQADSPTGTTLVAAINGTQEVPPTSSAAVGSGFFTFDAATSQLGFNITVFNLQGTETAANIHGPALPGANAPILFSLPLGSPKSGAITLTPAQAADLLAGNLYVNVHTTAFPDGEIRGQIAQTLLSAAVLPSSRSVQVGTPATAFATILNTGPNAAVGCSLAPATSIPASFSYQTTNPVTNTVTGTPNTPVDIASGGSQSFVVSFTPTAPIAPTDVQLTFDCANTPPVPVITGVNTLLLSASSGAVPDVIAIAIAPTTLFPGPGVLVLDSTTRQGAFAVAAINIGASASLTVTADTGGASLPLTITLCQTTVTGACVNPSAPSVTLTMPSGAGAGFAVFVAAAGPIKFNAAVNRIFVRVKDASGVTRGSTSLAVQAQ